MTNEITALFLAVYFTVVAVFYLFRLNMTATQKVFNGRALSMEWLGQWTFKVFQWVIWAICVARVFNPSIDRWLWVFEGLHNAWVNMAGLAILLVGTIGVVWAHFALGASWSSGVNANGNQALIETGIYHYSRNPIFISVMLCQLGFFLLLPSLFSLICLSLGCFFIIRQVAVEERFLSQRFGAAYQQYQSATPRWI